MMIPVKNDLLSVVARRLGVSLPDLRDWCPLLSLQALLEVDNRIFPVEEWNRALAYLLGRPCAFSYVFEADVYKRQAGYPVCYIPNAEMSGKGRQPETVIFLTADAFGVLPPISKLDNDMAMFHFVSGYTSKLAGTERGITEPQTTFSTCFGAPFLPLNPSVYAEMLGEKIKNNNARVF